jgi:hypothetical protein
MVRNWTFTLFFCMSELWGDVCLGLLFWGLANDTTTLADAPTLYPLFGLGANVAQALAGSVLKVGRSMRSPAEDECWVGRDHTHGFFNGKIHVGSCQELGLQAVGPRMLLTALILQCDCLGLVDMKARSASIARLLNHARGTCIDDPTPSAPPPA